MSRQVKKFLVIILLISTVVRVAVAIVLGEQVKAMPGIFDQISYHNLAVRVLNGFGFTFGEDWWPLTDAGQPTAHWSYLYTLYLVLVYKILGVHPLAARMIQAIIAGVLQPYLVFRIAQIVFHKAAGRDWISLLGAAWCAVYGYFAYYSGALMTEAFYISALLWVILLSLELSIDLAKFNPGRWVLLGVAIAFTVMLRQVFLIFVPFLFLWLVACGAITGSGLRKTGVWQGVIISTIATAILIAPITLHNYQKFHRFVLLNTNAGYAFFWANHPVHGNYFKPLFTEDMPSYQEVIPVEYRDLNEAELEHALLRLGEQFVIENPGRYLLLCLSRIPSHFIFWPLSTSSTISNIVRVGSFGLAFPFMLIGIFLYFRNFSIFQIKKVPEGGVLLALFLFIYTAIHLASWSGIRYRLPTDVVGLIFAAYAAWKMMNLLIAIVGKNREVKHETMDG